VTASKIVNTFVIICLPSQVFSTGNMCFEYCISPCFNTSTVNAQNEPTVMNKLGMIDENELYTYYRGGHVAADPTC
jgi:hypothetical protein